MNAVEWVEEGDGNLEGYFPGPGSRVYQKPSFGSVRPALSTICVQLNGYISNACASLTQIIEQEHAGGLDAEQTQMLKAAETNVRANLSALYAKARSLGCPLLLCSPILGLSGIEWVGTLGDQAACDAFKSELANVQNSLKNAQDDLVALDAARIAAAQAGDDATLAQLNAQRSGLLAAVAAAQAAVNDLNSKIANCMSLCDAGYKSVNGKCVPISSVTGCATDADCGADKECVQGLCVDKCPAGQVRDAQGNCAVPPAAKTSSAGTWGLALLAAGAAAAIFFGLKPPAMTAADKARAKRYKELQENPRGGSRTRAKGRFVLYFRDEQGTFMVWSSHGTRALAERAKVRAQKEIPHRGSFTIHDRRTKKAA